MDLRQLKAFLAVCDAGSLSAASQKIRIAVSAISLHVANLEAELGMVLFERRTKGMHPTEAGLRLALHGRSILKAVEDARSDVLSMSQVVVGQVEIGMASSAISGFGGWFLKEMSHRYPRVEISITESVAAEHAHSLLQSSLDLAVIFNPVMHPDLLCTKLLSEPMYCIGRRELIGATDDPVELQQVLGYPMVLPRQPDTMPALADDPKVLKALDRPAFQLRSSSALREAVFAGLGVTITSSQFFARDTRGAQIAMRRIIAPEIWRTLYLCQHQDRPASQARDACRKCIEDAVATLLRENLWPGAAEPSSSRA